MTKNPTPAEIRHQLTETYARACVELKAAEAKKDAAQAEATAAHLAYGEALGRMHAARRRLNHTMYAQAGLVVSPANEAPIEITERGVTTVR